MLSFALFTVVAQNPAPSIEPMSFYGMRTYANQANFGFLGERWNLVMAPGSYEGMTFHLLQGGQEVGSQEHYFDDTPWPAFKMGRLKNGSPVFLEKEGDYMAEFRIEGKTISALPFRITKKSGGDAYNPTTAWDYQTPIDRMGQLHVDQARDGVVTISFMMHPAKEGIPTGSTYVAKFTHNGQSLGVSPDKAISDPHNQKYWTRLRFLASNGRGKELNWSDLAKMSGTLKVEIIAAGKLVRTFTYTASAPGQIKGHARSETSFTPATGHYPPRRLFVDTANMEMHHVWWADSK